MPIVPLPPPATTAPSIVGGPATQLTIAVSTTLVRVIDRTTDPIDLVMARDCGGIGGIGGASPGALRAGSSTVALGLPLAKRSKLVSNLVWQFVQVTVVVHSAMNPPGTDREPLVMIFVAAAVTKIEHSGH